VPDYVLPHLPDPNALADNSPVCQNKVWNCCLATVFILREIQNHKVWKDVRHIQAKDVDLSNIAIVNGFDCALHFKSR
jgi:hypothetical protein